MNFARTTPDDSIKDHTAIFGVYKVTVEYVGYHVPDINRFAQKIGTGSSRLTVYCQVSLNEKNISETRRILPRFRFDFHFLNLSCGQSEQLGNLPPLCKNIVGG